MQEVFKCFLRISESDLSTFKKKTSIKGYNFCIG